MDGERPKEDWQDRRASERVSDDSTLLISGYSKAGLPFASTARIRDISLGGISFFVGTQVEKDEVLDVTICPELRPGVVYSAKARVLRVSSHTDSPAPHLVAAKFEREFVEFSTCSETEGVAQQLVRAIEFDERKRSATVPTQDRISAQCEVCGSEFEDIQESGNPVSHVLCLRCRHWEQETTEVPQQLTSQLLDSATELPENSQVATTLT